MALGGFNAGTWDNTKPAAGDSVGLGDDNIRSVKTTLQQALDSEHVWPSAGGVVGQHRAGSARAFYGPKSQVSASDASSVADGRMMILSDVSRLMSTGSVSPFMLGAGPGSLSVDTSAGISFPQVSRWAMEVGIVASAASTFNVAFPNSGFSGVPFLQVSPYTQTIGGGTAAMIVKLDAISPSGFSCQLLDSSNHVAVSNCGIQWMSVGTRAL